ncbi:MAG: hypothetical protein PVG14_09755 [Anaerolineales bacterium]|jgi:hypothetical protein
MEEALRFLRNNEIFIYLGLGVIAVWYIRKFILAWEELRSAAFGLERESAQGHLNRAASMLVFILVLAVVEFAAVSFVAPAVPGSTPLFTPTIDLLATPSVTLPDSMLEAVASSPQPTVQLEGSECIPGEININSPQNEETVRDIVEITGSVDVPNFGFYKFEMSTPGSSTWLTIQAGETITQEGKLGFWDTTRLTPGDYALRLIVTDNEGNILDPCVVRVRVAAPSELEP